MKYSTHTFKNGLTLLAEDNPSAHTAAVGFFVRAGTRDEDKTVEGVSHFLEHMMFKGTARRSADDVNREFDEIGADYNAFTSHEQTVYYAHVLPELLDRSIDLLGDMLRPALRESDFDMEKNVILEEIGMYDDRPTWRLQDAMLEKHYRGHPMGYRVLGTTDSIKALDVDQMRGYFAHRYSPDNIAVSVAGKIDLDAIIKQIETLSESWNPTGATRKHDVPETSDGELTLKESSVNRFYLAALSAGPSAQDPTRHAANVMANVLGDSDGSRMYWALIDPGMADEADLDYSPHDQTGAYMAYVSCDPDNAEKVEEILFETIDTLAADPSQISAEEVARTKNKLATSMTLGGESPAGRMHNLGMRWCYGRPYETLEQQLAKLTTVTLDDVQSVLSSNPFAPRTIARLGPAPTTAAVEA